MSQLRVYEDPRARLAGMSLLDGLSKAVATKNLLPQEDQLSTVLAWLSDKDLPLARRLAIAFAGDDQELKDAVADSQTIGARTQVRLPDLGKGPLWVDISLAGEDRKFELLVEVKVGSDFHLYDHPDQEGTLFQPDAYIYAWRNCEPAQEAEVRRLGTITMQGKAPSIDDPWRVRDLAWQEIVEVVEDSIQSSTGQDGAALLQGDFVSYVRHRILPPVLEPGFLEWGAELTRGVCEKLALIAPGSKVSGAFAPKPDSHYVGGYLTVDTQFGTREQLWFVVSPAGGDYNVPGWDSNLQITSVYENPVTEEGGTRLAASGFVAAKDKAGYTLVRTMLPVSEIRRADQREAQIDVAASWARDRLAVASFL